MNKAGKELLTRKERIMLTAYLCPAGKPTIGRGHTLGITMQMVKDKYTISKEEEEKLFEQDMASWTLLVKQMFKRTPNENQLAAMVCLTYNIGQAAFRKSTVLRCFERGDDIAAANAFSLFDKITNPKTKELEVSNGLVLRRKEEAALYLTPVAGEVVKAMPQEVAPEKPMAASTINRSAIIGGSTAAIVTVTETIKSVNALKTSVEGLGNWLVPLLLLVTVACAGYIIWERFNLRKRGQA